MAREVRAAALLAWLVRRAGQVEALAGLDAAIGFLVGLSDNVSVARDGRRARSRRRSKRAADLAQAGTCPPRSPPDCATASARHASASARRSASARPATAPEVPLPEIFQLFGQRFVIDSFITSKLVFDSIMFEGRQQEREMPTGWT